ncbi:MAG TPA: potassium transporter Kup [Candidatus Limnocylindria bacterium]|nr:potassium transporter Kup [Candidatus Limnocylindria bacterium]
MGTPLAAGLRGEKPPRFGTVPWRESLPDSGYRRTALVMSHAADSPAEHPASSPTPLEPDESPASRPGGHHHENGLALLALGALGVVYGDIGTSPLYAVKECFHPHLGLQPVARDVLGILSLVFWSLTLVIVVKYLTFIMRADNRGEGGILALLAQLRGRGSASVFAALAIFGAALLYGDGVITPAISVLSAMEGLNVATPVFAPWVVPLTVAILTALFVAQQRGTANVASVFGPITLVWFVSIALLALPSVLAVPSVLAAVNPLRAVDFFLHHDRHAFFVLGSVVLCITGGEALYADMGHFGRTPIRVAWYVVVFPALVLSYFGQGALLLERCGADVDGDACRLALQNPFYALVPPVLLYPMVMVAAAATVVASQAMISGAFSLTQQAVQLGYVPRVQIRHTSAATQGQIYVPVVNWALMVGCIAVVLIAGSSSRLAAAYGIAVTGAMSITSVLFFAVARQRWGWSLLAATALAGAFLTVDLAFFTANIVKFAQGGWFPMIAGLGVFTLMWTWRDGGRWRAREFAKQRVPLEDFLLGLQVDPPQRVRGTAIFMTQDPEGTPPALLHQLKHNQVLHDHVVILTFKTVNEPEVAPRDRVQLTRLSQGFWRLIGRYGFMETPNVPEILRLAADAGLATTGRRSFFLGRETFVPGGRCRMARWRKRLFMFMVRNARSPAEFYGIPPNDVVELGAQIQM